MVHRGCLSVVILLVIGVFLTLLAVHILNSKNEPVALMQTGGQTHTGREKDALEKVTYSATQIFTYVAFVHVHIRLVQLIQAPVDFYCFIKFREIISPE